MEDSRSPVRLLCGGFSVQLSGGLKLGELPRPIVMSHLDSGAQGYSQLEIPTVQA